MALIVGGNIYGKILLPWVGDLFFPFITAKNFYFRIIVEVIFSLWAIQNQGQEGYQQCIQDKCQRKGQEFCSKQREISNCCQGAGGELAIAEGKLTCVFA